MSKPTPQIVQGPDGRTRMTRTLREKFVLPHNLHQGPPPPIETLRWYWHPDRIGVEQCPSEFRRRLHEIDPELEVVKGPLHKAFSIWVKNPRIQHPICRGWHLIMVWEHPRTKEPLPLDEMLFANLFLISAGTQGNAQQYFERVMADIKRKQESRERRYESERAALQEELYDGLKISSAGKGNKFSLHHDGTMVPSRGEMNWRAETRKQRMPSELLQQEKDDREKERYGS